jgi:glycosyltransferase involved in cell wall biosynthesis
MKIGIYVDVAKDEKPSGIGLHVRKLIDCLAELDQENEYLLYYQCGLLESANVFPHCPDAPNFRRRPVRFPESWKGSHPRLWWNWALARAVRKDGVDVFHGPNHFLPQLDGISSVVTMHDLAYFYMDVHGDSENDMLRTWTKSALVDADAVIALSKNTKNDCVEQGAKQDDVHVIYGGGNVVPDEKIEFDRADEMRKHFGLPEKYVLFVGTLQPRKNVPFLIKAFAEMKKAGGFPHGLVLAGKRDTAAEEIDALIAELGIADDVVITGYVEDWHLPLLYKLADLFVLPTLYEGFTLVTIESMAYGTPVISTNTSSIREGVGDAAVLVDVNDVDALGSAMTSILSDEDQRQSMIQQGRERASKFTWERMAGETLALYQEVTEPVTKGVSVTQS